MKKNIRLIYILYGISLLIIIVISSFFYKKFNSLVDYSNKVEHTYQVINTIERVQLLLVSAEDNQRASIIRKDSSLLESQVTIHKKILAELDKLQRLVWANEKQRPNLIFLKNSVSSRFQLLQQTANNMTEANFRRGMAMMEQFNKVADKMEQEERLALEENTNQKLIFEAATPKYLLLILCVTCIFQVLSFAFILKEFKTRHMYQKELEDKIKDLNVTNSELEQIAFVASHDLQEPLRKIRTFSDRLVQKQQNNLDEEGREILNKIITASLRMQGLMEDLVSYTTIIQTDGANQVVDLNRVVETVKSNLQETINKRGVIINKAGLPEVLGQQKQLQLLFTNLLDNAMKFSKAGTSPIIDISTTKVTGEEIDKKNANIAGHHFHKVSVSDNGIGFDQSFAHKIFIIFQRLHTQNSPYQGKGIGLAISRRVMMNHNGFIEAEGEPGNGATFNLYFPEIVS